jgi:hypothetical protein
MDPDQTMSNTNTYSSSSSNTDTKISSNDNNNEKIIEPSSTTLNQFLLATNSTDIDVATGWIEAADGDVNKAIELYLLEEHEHEQQQPLSSSQNQQHHQTDTNNNQPFTESPEFDMYRSLATHRTPEVASETIQILAKILDNIVQKPQEEKLQTLRLNNPKVTKLIKEPRGVLPYLFRMGWIQEHLVSGEMNESVLRFKGIFAPLGKRVENLNVLLAAISSLNLTVILKVGLPTGTSGSSELCGAFDPLETIGVIRNWVKRVRMDPGGQHFDPPELGLSENPSLVLENEQTIASANLHQKKLLVKKAGNVEEARAKLKEQAQEERLRWAKERERTVAKARQVTADKRAKRANAAQAWSKNIQRFEEDRIDAEERAKRVVAKVAGTSSSNNNNNDNSNMTKPMS